MKAKKLFLLSFIMSVFCIILPACDIIDSLLGKNEQEACNHTLTHTEEVTSTCIKQGNTEYWYCTLCEKYFSDENAEDEISETQIKLPLLPHSYGDWVTVTQPTEQSAGLKKQTCEVCGYVNEQVIEKLEHTHKYSETWSSDETGHWHAATCGCTDAGTKDFAVHSYGEWVIITQPTEQSAGLKNQTCEVCEFINEQVIERLEHTHKYSETWSSDETGHWHAATCSCADAGTKDFAVHSYGEWVTVTQPTEQSTGLKKQTCEVCEFVNEQVIEKLEHTHKYSATWSSDETGHWHAATCGCTDAGTKDFAVHSYGEWVTVTQPTEQSTGLKKQTCEVCGYVNEQEIAKLEHTHKYSDIWSADETGHWHAATCGCTDAGTKDFAIHSYGDWVTVTQPTEQSTGLKKQTCEVCEFVNEQVIEKLEHTHKYSETWSADETGHWHATTCGCTDAGKSEYSAHDFATDNKCRICGYLNPNVTSTITKYSSDYGYNTLNANEKKYYELVDHAISAFHASGNAKTNSVGSTQYRTLDPINFSNLGLNVERAQAVYNIYRADHPIYYWLSLNLLFTSTSLLPVVIDEYAEQAARIAVNTSLYEKIDCVYKSVSGEDDYHTALAYHDAIINAVEYAYDSNGIPQSKHWAHSVLGIFFNGQGEINGAVCEGYARSFQILLNLSGIENVYVTGVGRSGNSYEGHAWNLAKIGNKYYQFDLTWDDQPAQPLGKIYDYFAKGSTNEKFSTTHTANVTLSGNALIADKLYDLPADTATNDFTGEGAIFAQYSSGGLDYVVCGYNELQLIRSSAQGTIVIPESQIFSGRSYKVTVIGNVYGDNNTLNNVFSEGATEITIPSSVAFIWDIAFRVNSLKAISVAENNEYFCSQDGVLYTKSKYTLIAYPAARTGSSYTLAQNTHVIALYAFLNCNLTTLNIGTQVSEFYLANFGMGYLDSAKEHAEKMSEIQSLAQSLNASGLKTRLTLAEFKSQTNITNVNVS